MKIKMWKIGAAVFAAALLAFFSQCRHRVAALFSPAPPRKAAATPPGPDGQRSFSAEKPAGVVLEAGEKKIKTAFIDCNGIYN